MLTALYGPVDLKTNQKGIPFNLTNYYEKEMGPNIWKQLLSFKNIIKPDDIAGIKIKTNALENKMPSALKSNMSRPVNLDPGYVNLSKVVLLTTKDYSHRIYVRNGIYGEIALEFKNPAKGTKGFQPLPMTYRDYKTQPYLDFFNKMRNIYLELPSDKMG